MIYPDSIYHAENNCRFSPPVRQFPVGLLENRHLADHPLIQMLKSRQGRPAKGDTQAQHPTPSTSQDKKDLISVVCTGLHTGFYPWSPFLYTSSWQSHPVSASIITSVGITPVAIQSFFLCVYLKPLFLLKITLPSQPLSHLSLSSIGLLGCLEDIFSSVYILTRVITWLSSLSSVPPFMAFTSLLFLSWKQVHHME